MKQALALIALAAASVSSFAGPDVGVSVSVSQPGVYGRIDIGNAPPPVVINPQPVIVVPPPQQTVVVERRPIYLRVPPGHQKNWKRYCGNYAACGQPVYFVREDWYQEHWRREHEHDHDHDHDHDRGPGRGHGRGHDKHDKHGRD